MKAIQPVFYSTGKTDTTVIIESDGAQTVADTVAPPEVTDQASFLAAIKKSGLVGLGGAASPPISSWRRPTSRRSTSTW